MEWKRFGSTFPKGGMEKIWLNLSQRWNGKDLAQPFPKVDFSLSCILEDILNGCIYVEVKGIMLL